MSALGQLLRLMYISWVLVRHRRQDVERAHPLRRERRVGDRCVLHVERRVVGQHVLVLDLVEVLRVVLGDVDVVVGKVVFPLDAEIHHEGRARIFLF